MAQITESTLVGRRTRAEIGVAGILLTAAAVAVVLAESAPQDRAVSALVHALCIGLPIALGLFRLSRDGSDRFAWLLVGIGLLGSLPPLAEAGNPTLYSIGRTSVWPVEAALVYLMLAFPFGRLEGKTERRLVCGGFALVALLYLPPILLAPFPEPSPWATCGTSCPHNAFDIAAGTPG